MFFTYTKLYPATIIRLDEGFDGEIFWGRVLKVGFYYY
jgi:hypothetical protein